MGALLVTLGRAAACGVLTCGWALTPQPATATAAATAGNASLAEPLAAVTRMTALEMSLR
jgi:hypothetical protein